MPESNEPKKLILGRLSDLEIAITEDDKEIANFDSTLLKLRQPTSDKRNFQDRYISFWRVWTDLDTDDRKLAIKCIVKEFRLFKINDKNYWLEMDYT